MDVPFVSSGALNRAHYALVRKIESATSIQSANQLLIPEIKSRREQLGRPGLSLEQCKELLIILLYCRMTITHGFLPNDVFDFALPHAVGLAEAGQRLEQKRIGYLFCAEVMPPTHELQLMLVNTLRKDLESDRIPQICLALDNVIVSYNEDLIPAIQSRLHDLLSHTSSAACAATRFAGILLAFSLQLRVVDANLGNRHEASGGSVSISGQRRIGHF